MQSLLSAVQASFSDLKRRLGSTAVGGTHLLDRPVFGFDLQLRVPSVVLHPSLEEIQEAIDSTAKKARQAPACCCSSHGWMPAGAAWIACMPNYTSVNGGQYALRAG